MQVVLRLVFVAILSRLLLPDDFGIMAAASIVIGFSELLSRMGMGPALVHDREINDEKINTAFTFSLLLGVLLALLFLGINPQIEKLFALPGLREVLDVLVLLFPIRSLNQVSMGLIQRAQRFKDLAGLEAFSYLIGYGGLGIVLALNGYGVWALVIGTLAQAVLYSSLLFWRQPHTIKLQIKSAAFKQLLNFGGGYTLAQFFSYSAKKADYFIIGRILGADQLGFYSRSYTVIGMMNSIVGKNIQLVLFSDFSQAKNRKERDKNAEDVLRIASFSFLLLIPVSCLLVIFAEEIVWVLLGAKWVVMVPCLQVLSLGMVARIGYKIFGAYILGIGKVNQYSIIQAAYLALVAIGAYFGVIWGGIFGAAILVTAAIFIVFFIYVCYFVAVSEKVLIQDLVAVFQDGLRVLILILPLYPLLLLLKANQLESQLLILLAGGAYLAIVLRFVLWPYRARCLSKANLEIIERFIGRLKMKQAA